VWPRRTTRWCRRCSATPTRTCSSTRAPARRWRRRPCSPRRAAPACRW
jgi:hypothetical protein